VVHHSDPSRSEYMSVALLTITKASRCDRS
jgi:hypothetical protein